MDIIENEIFHTPAIWKRYEIISSLKEMHIWNVLLISSRKKINELGTNMCGANTYLQIIMKLIWIHKEYHTSFFMTTIESEIMSPGTCNMWNCNRWQKLIRHYLSYGVKSGDFRPLITAVCNRNSAAIVGKHRRTFSYKNWVLSPLNASFAFMKCYIMNNNI